MLFACLSQLFVYNPPHVPLLEHVRLTSLFYGSFSFDYCHVGQIWTHFDTFGSLYSEPTTMPLRNSSMKICALSDTHGNDFTIPQCDVFVIVAIGLRSKFRMILFQWHRGWKRLLRICAICHAVMSSSSRGIMTRLWTALWVKVCLRISSIASVCVRLS